MKTLIQLFLFFLIIILSFFFYKKYFSNKVSDTEIILPNEKIEKTIIDEKTINDEILKKNTENELNKEKNPNSNNSIQNLKYKVKLPENKMYEIIANSSELTYKNNSEVIIMNKVKATFIDNKNKVIKIESDKAIFNNTNYNTDFNTNVKIEYLDNLISSNKLSYNFERNEILIQEDIIYEGVYGIIEADNILINILSKDIKVFMNNSNNKIKIKSY